MVEFALVVPVLILLVVGIAEFGRAYYTQATLAGAAREGVRVMAVQNDSSAARAAVRAYSPGLGVTDGDISITPGTCPAATGTTPPPDARVTVTYPLTFLTGLFGSGATITGRGVMRCNG